MNTVELLEALEDSEAIVESLRTKLALRTNEVAYLSSRLEVANCILDDTVRQTSTQNYIRDHPGLTLEQLEAEGVEPVTEELVSGGLVDVLNGKYYIAIPEVCACCRCPQCGGTGQHEEVITGRSGNMYSYRCNTCNTELGWTM